MAPATRTEMRFRLGDNFSPVDSHLNRHLRDPNNPRLMHHIKSRFKMVLGPLFVLAIRDQDENAIQKLDSFSDSSFTASKNYVLNMLIELVQDDICVVSNVGDYANRRVGGHISSNDDMCYIITPEIISLAMRVLPVAYVSVAAELN